MCTILGISCECLEAIASSITALATGATAVIALVACWYSKKEYDSHKEREKAATLAKYNERYATDPNIQKVTNYLLWRSDNQTLGVKPDKVLYGGKDEDDIKPTKNQVELFMRFYEELQLAIDAGRIDVDSANNLFAYYAHELPRIGNDLLPEDYNPNEGMWRNFQRFIQQTNQPNKIKV